MSDFTLGLQLMGYGLLGTFGVLFAFILIIALLTKIFPEGDKKDDQGG